MIATAIDKILSLGKVDSIVVDGLTYTGKAVSPIGKPIAARLSITTLTGLVDFIAAAKGDFQDEWFIHVESPTLVHIVSGLTPVHRTREFYATAKSPDDGDFYAGRWWSHEEFMINLQSNFLETPDRETLLRILGTITDEQVKQVHDDGVTQTVTTRSGAAFVKDMEVPRVVSLQPWRTFREIEQPLSTFILRLRKDFHVALFEAEGAAWKLEAIRRIKDWLEYKLGGKDGPVIVA